jgi:hypothetical protein
VTGHAAFPSCPRRACSVGFGLFCLVAFLPHFSWPLLIPTFFALRFFDCLSLNVSFRPLSLVPLSQHFVLDRACRDQRICVIAIIALAMPASFS